MEPSIEWAFQSMVDRKEFSEALDFISTLHDKVPHFTVLRTIIFKILMDNDCEKKVALNAGLYLSNLLTLYPPSDVNRRQYYKNGLRDSSKKNSDLWTTFCYLVESSLDHYRVYLIFNEQNELKPVPYPHCDILIDFYIKVFQESFKCILTERVFYDNKEKSLIAELFWPSDSTEFSAAKENSRVFLGWINSIYIHGVRIQKIPVFRSLHQLLNLMISCIIATKNIRDISQQLERSRENMQLLEDSLINSSLCLLDIVKVIMNTCKNIFVSHENLRRFLSNCSLKYLKIKICEYKLFELLYNRQPSERNISPLTLKDIVNKYMFPANFKKRGRPPVKETGSVDTSKSKVPKITYKMTKRGDTDLHSVCRLNKPADLFEMLCSSPPPDVNAKNFSGYTPLHVACISGTDLCAKVLIDTCSAEDFEKNIDWTAADENGFTALHIAIQRNLCKITKMILNNGGPELLLNVDKFKRKPQHYANSKDMEKLLTEYLPYSSTLEADDAVSILNSVLNLTIHNLETFKEYALYFHALHFLISFYSDIFHIFDAMIVMKKDKSLIQTLPHEDKACCHFKPYEENTICSLDLCYLYKLPDILNHFIECAFESTKEKDLTLDLELLPLQTYVAVFQNYL